MTRQLVHIVVRGQVQGVSFRAWTQRHARDHGVDGWVRNREDGAVEAVLAGEDRAVESVIEACREGPPAALVTDLISLPWSLEPPSGFSIRP